MGDGAADGEQRIAMDFESEADGDLTSGHVPTSPCESRHHQAMVGDGPLRGNRRELTAIPVGRYSDGDARGLR